MKRTYNYRTSDICSIEGCLKPFVARGWCGMHYSRWKTHGDPLTLVTPAETRRDDAGYDAAHDRCRQDRGSAREHECVECQRPAQEWAYNHKDPAQRTCKRGRTYSLDPSFYDPMCCSCHRKIDLGIMTPKCVD